MLALPISKLDALTLLIMRNKRLVFSLLLCALLVVIIYLFAFKFKIFRMLKPAQEALLEKYPAPVRLKMRAFLNAIIDKGYEVTITSAVRLNGSDPHTRKHAIDINIKSKTTGKSYLMATPKAEWLATSIPEIALKMGFRWGGNFHTPYMYNGTMRNPYDPVHFDLE